MVRETVDNKPLLTGFLATFFTFSSSETLHDVQLLLIVVYIFSILSSYCLLRQFFTKSVAIIACCILFTPIPFGAFFESKLTSLRGECFAYPYLFMGLWLNYIGIVGEKRRYFLIGLIINLFAIYTHGVVGSILVITSLCFIASKVLLGLWNKRFDSVSIIGIGISLLIPLLLFGVSNLQRFDSGNNPASWHGDDEYVDYVIRNKIDPTYEFVRLLNEDKEDLPVKYIKNGIMYTQPWEIINIAMRRNRLNMAAVFIGLLLSVVVLAANRGKDQAVMYTSLFLLCVAIMAWSFAFSLIFSTYMPAEHVLRRECRFLRLFFVFVMCGGIASLWDKDQPLLQRFSSKAGTCIIWICVSCFVLSHYIFLARRYESKAIGEKAVDALVWIQENTEEDDIILTNFRTTRFVKLFSERKCIIEGPAKYHASLIFDAISLLNGAREFFLAPDSEDSRNYLKRHNVKYIIYSTDVVPGNKITKLAYDVGKLMDVNYLNKVKKLSGEGASFIFEVNDGMLK